jgi:hypothetical protein
VAASLQVEPDWDRFGLVIPDEVPPILQLQRLCLSTIIRMLLAPHPDPAVIQHLHHLPHDLIAQVISALRAADPDTESMVARIMSPDETYIQLLRTDDVALCALAESRGVDPISLRLGDCHSLSERGLASLIRMCTPHLVELEVLGSANSLPEMDEHTLSAVVAAAPNLQRLVWHRAVTPTTLDSLAMLSALTELDVALASGIDRLTLPAAHTVTLRHTCLSGAVTMQCPRLRSLALSAMTVVMNALAALLRGLPHLRCVQLDHVELLEPADSAAAPVPDDQDAPRDLGLTGCLVRWPWSSCIRVLTLFCRCSSLGSGGGA